MVLRNHETQPCLARWNRAVLALQEPIEPVEMEQSERVIEQPVLAAQQSEIRNAPRIRHDGFAIQDQVRCREGCERIGDRLKAQRPIIACACVDGRLAVSQVRLRAVAIELDLVNPASA
jgi:hypothetical protein